MKKLKFILLFLLGFTQIYGQTISRRSTGTTSYSYTNASDNVTIITTAGYLGVKPNSLAYTFLDTTTGFRFPVGINALSAPTESVPSIGGTGLKASGTVYGVATTGGTGGIWSYSLSGNAALLTQAGVLTGSVTSSVVDIYRLQTLGAYTSTGALLRITDAVGSTGDLVSLWNSSTELFDVDYQGTGYFAKGFHLGSSAPASSGGAFKYTGSDIQAHDGTKWWSLTNSQQIMGKPVSDETPVDGYVLAYTASDDSLNWVLNAGGTSFWTSTDNTIVTATEDDSVALGGGGGLDSAETWIHIRSTNTSTVEDMVLLENLGTTVGTGVAIVYRGRDSEDTDKEVRFQGYTFDDAVGGNFGWRMTTVGNGTAYNGFDFYHNGSSIILQGKQSSFLIKDSSGDTRISINNTSDMTLSDIVTSSFRYTTTPSADYIMRSDGSGNASWVDVSTVLDNAVFSDLSDVVGTWARGDILYNNGTNWVNLTVGTAGQVLKSDGTDVSWGADATGAGGSSTADSASTDDGNWDFDDYFNTAGKLDTTNIAVASWSDFVNDNSDTSLLMLDDTPSTYSGQGNKLLKVNNGATAVEFVTMSGDATMDASGVVTIASLDISDDTNLSASAPATLTGDAVGVDTTDATNAALATQYDITNIDLSDDVNLTVTAPVTLTGDAIGVDTTNGNAHLGTQYDDLVLRNAFEKREFVRTLVNPDSLSFPGNRVKLMSNQHGSTITISKIICTTDKTTQSYLATFFETTAFDSTSANTIEAVTVNSSGTGVFYSSVTSIDHATIEDTNEIWLLYDTTKDIRWLTVEIYYSW